MRKIGFKLVKLAAGMHAIVHKMARVLMIAGLVTKFSPILEPEAHAHIPYRGRMATEALALRPVAFDSKLYPPKVRDYLHSLSYGV
jgi:hypothetical protein